MCWELTEGSLHAMHSISIFRVDVASLGFDAKAVVLDADIKVRRIAAGEVAVNLVAVGGLDQVRNQDITVRRHLLSLRLKQRAEVIDGRPERQRRGTE
jgi:hypothetical protein